MSIITGHCGQWRVNIPFACKTRPHFLPLLLLKNETAILLRKLHLLLMLVVFEPDAKHQAQNQAAFGETPRPRKCKAKRTAPDALIYAGCCEQNYSSIQRKHALSLHRRLILVRWLDIASPASEEQQYMATLHGLRSPTNGYLPAAEAHKYAMQPGTS
ncbi:hypothetical protein PMIN03_000741 [Paraphaeosphaeria minitans]